MHHVDDIGVSRTLNTVCMPRGVSGALRTEFPMGSGCVWLCGHALAQRASAATIAQGRITARLVTPPPPPLSPLAAISACSRPASTFTVSSADDTPCPAADGSTGPSAGGSAGGAGIFADAEGGGGEGFRVTDAPLCTTGARIDSTRTPKRDVRAAESDDASACAAESAASIVACALAEPLGMRMVTSTSTLAAAKASVRTQSGTEHERLALRRSSRACVFSVPKSETSPATVRLSVILVAAALPDSRGGGAKGGG